MKFGLIGEHLGHSFSKKVHGMLGNHSYELKELSKEELPIFLSKKEFEGINVTLPYKQDVIPFLDVVSSEVKAIGACNTIVNKGGRLFGYNTDAYGLEMLIKKVGVDIANKRCAILGTGGTSKTAYYVLSILGASSIIKVSRTGKDGAVTYEDLDKEIEVIVNTTPCGMHPNSDQSPLDLQGFPNLKAVIDVIYNPLRSKLVSQAKSLLLPAEGGLYMLVGQAIKASEYFLDKPYEPGVLDTVFHAIYQQEESIVLIGMPTSGKSTIGKELAKQLDREFIDVDAKIEERIGMSIPSFLSKANEKEFRDKEEEVILELAKLPNVVIATGGGSILRPINIERLKRNGRVYFLNRSLENLIASKSRPLSNDLDSLKKRYEERYDIYCASADVTINGDLRIEQIVTNIIGERA